MRIPLGGGFEMSALGAADRAALVAHLAPGEIQESIPVIPYPYGEADADAWIALRARFVERFGREISFAIREPGGAMVGSMGVDDFPVGARHVAEVGYWIAPALRGRGLATRSLRAFVAYAFDRLDLGRLTAHTLVHHERSARVLEKAGFRPEGLLRRHTRTRSGLHDTRAWGLLRQDLALEETAPEDPEP